MKRRLLILSFVPLIVIGQNTLSKTTITDGKIVEDCYYYEDGGYKVTTYRYHDEWIDTISIVFDKNGDSSVIFPVDEKSCNFEKIYNDNNQLILRYWYCVEGDSDDAEYYLEDMVEYMYNDRDGLIKTRECFGEGEINSENYTYCNDNMRVTYYHYNKENYLIEKIVSIRENRNQFSYDTVFNNIETIQKRIRYDYDMYGNNIMITEFNDSAEIISTDIMTYENNLLQKKELMAEDTIVIDYQYDQDDKLIGVGEHWIGYYNYYEKSEEFSHTGQLIFTSEYSRGPDYECYYQYNNDGNLIIKECYEIYTEGSLNECVVSVYNYNSYGDLIEIIDYYVYDEEELNSIYNEGDYDTTKLIRKLKKGQLYEEKSVTNIKYEYY